LEYFLITYLRTSSRHCDRIKTITILGNKGDSAINQFYGAAFFVGGSTAINQCLLEGVYLSVAIFWR
jgi:hypothetical protein